eukprot:5055580-Amphidinium_carterae.1
MRDVDLSLSQGEGPKEYVPPPSPTPNLPVHGAKRWVNQTSREIRRTACQSRFGQAPMQEKLR